MQYAYPARVRVHPDGAVLTFRDLPNVLAGGKDRAHAIEKAEGVLEAALWFCLKDGADIPAPSAPKRGDVLVPVALGMAAKIAFASAFRDSGLSRVDFATRLDTNEKEVRRMLDPAHPTKIERLASALRVLGRRLIVTEEAA